MSGFDYNNPKETRAKFGQAKVRKLVEEFESLWRKLVLSDKMTPEIQHKIADMKTEYENERRVLLEAEIKREIEYLKLELESKTFEMAKI